MDKEFNLVAALRIILKWKNHILVLTLASGIIAALFSIFVMDEWYLSWSTLYPTNMSRSVRNEIFGESVTNVDYYGGKQEVNRVLTIANSNPVIDFVIDSFHLAEHYGVPRTKKFWRTIVRKKLEKKYTAIKTERDAVEISLYDTDPKFASDVVNEVVKKVDDLNKRYVESAKTKQYGALSKEILKVQSDVSVLSDSIAGIGEKYNIKVSVGTDGTMIIDGKDYKAVQLYKQVLSKQTNASRELNNLINIQGQLSVAGQNTESSLFVLEEAFPAERREKPVRSLVVLISVLITAFVSVIGVLLIEQIRDIKAQL
jgi:capsular polysaccharide biosynthesis protein